MTARAWAAFVGVATLWGIPYLFIKVAVDDGLSPAMVAWVRVTLAAAILLVLARRAGVLRAAQPHLRWIAAYAAAEIVLPFPLIGFGEQRISSSLTAILIATVPMNIALLALRFDHSERVRGLRLIGVFVGFAGVMALVGIDVAGRPSELLGAAAVLTAAVGYAVGPLVLKRRLAGLDARAVMGFALSISAVALALPAAASAPATMPPGESIVALGVLGVLCTAAAFVLYGILVGDVGPSRASVITYVSPVVAVALGVTVLDERVGPGAAAGLLLILAGSWLSTDGRIPPGLVTTWQRLPHPRARSRTPGRAPAHPDRAPTRRAAHAARPG